MLYIAAENADSTSEQATNLGGKILAPAFDVFDVGRMAVIQDPTGAVFAVWQAKRHPGVGVLAEEGALCWADLNTSDPKTAADFYSQLFGWETEISKNDPSGYLHILNQGNYIGGIPPVREGQGSPHWLIYYQVSGIESVLERGNSGGGKIYQPPFTVPDTGKIAVLADPQGAVFALFEPIQKG
jgi:predicted enzyme related to lactoylglutathione lyase